MTVGVLRYFNVIRIVIRATGTLFINYIDGFNMWMLLLLVCSVGERSSCCSWSLDLLGLLAQYSFLLLNISCDIYSTTDILKSTKLESLISRWVFISTAWYLIVSGCIHISDVTISTGRAGSLDITINPTRELSTWCSFVVMICHLTTNILIILLILGWRGLNLDGTGECLLVILLAHICCNGILTLVFA
jgi:hypothetical protein